MWQRSLEYIDLIYAIADQLPRSEEFNLKSQIVRAATSVALNIAEGSTGQTNAEQARFLDLAIRSLIETVACQHIINQRKLLADLPDLRQAYRDSETLVAMLYKMRTTIDPDRGWLREDPLTYDLDSEQEDHDDL